MSNKSIDQFKAHVSESLKWEILALLGAEGDFDFLSPIGVKTLKACLEGQEFYYDIPIYLDNKVLPSICGIKADEAFSVTLNRDLLTKGIVVNDKAREHPCFEDMLKHGLASLILNHRVDENFCINKDYRLSLYKDADEFAVRFLEANPRNLIKYIEELKHKDEWVSERRIEFLKELIV